MIARDTSAEAHVVQLAVYERMGPVRRVELAFEMSERMRELAIEGIRARSPELSNDEAKLRLWRQLLGEQLFAAAFPGAGDERS